MCLCLFFSLCVLCLWGKSSSQFSTYLNFLQSSLHRIQYKRCIPVLQHDFTAPTVSSLKAVHSSAWCNQGLLHHGLLATSDDSTRRNSTLFLWYIISALYVGAADWYVSHLLYRPVPVFLERCNLCCSLKSEDSHSSGFYYAVTPALDGDHISCEAGTTPYSRFSSRKFGSVGALDMATNVGLTDTAYLWW